ncbi:MAG TPA: glutaredoxin family protein [Rudaea sp.]|jgi:glutaredoxin
MKRVSPKARRTGWIAAAALVALLAATSVGAQTFYKSTNPDGSVVYSDKPPVNGKVDKILEFPDLPSSPVPPLATPRLGAAQVSVTSSRPAVLMMHTPNGVRVVDAIDQRAGDPPRLSSRVDSAPAAAEPAIPPPPPATLYSAMWCGYCRRAKAYLADHGIAYLNVDIDTDDGRAAFANVGSGGIPLLMSGKKRVRGFKAEGYDSFFARR